VMSIYMLVFAFMPVGSLPAAALADHIGGPLTITLTGAVVCLLVVVATVAYPPYRRIE
jgi:hypothetical protein